MMRVHQPFLPCTCWVNTKASQKKKNKLLRALTPQPVQLPTVEHKAQPKANGQPQPPVPHTSIDKQLVEQVKREVLSEILGKRPLGPMIASQTTKRPNTYGFEPTFSCREEERAWFIAQVENAKEFLGSIPKKHPNRYAWIQHIKEE